MNKKRLAKMGVCSLLVGLLALTACSKKTTKEKTTVKPTTAKTTSTTNQTTKKTTTTKQTTINQGTLSYNVYVNDVLCGSGENQLTLEYSDDYNIYKYLKVEKVNPDGTKEIMNKSGFEIETDLTQGAGVGDYALTVKIGEENSVNINVTITPKVIDITNVNFKDKEYVFNDKEQELEVEGLDKLPSCIEANVTGNKATNAGEYTANVTFSSLSPNYKIGNVPSSLSNHKWTIKKAQAEFISVSDPSKACNGTPVSIDYIANVDADVTILYKAKDASDSEYSEDNIPFAAGEYTAKLVIEDASNYVGCSKTINFTLDKGIIKYPTMKNPTREEHYGVSAYTGSEQSFYDQLIGYNPEYMELDEYSNNPTQTEIGNYNYKFVIKDEYKDSFEFNNIKQYSWIISNNDISEYLSSITCDGEAVNMASFVAQDSVKGNSVYRFTPKEGFKVRIGTSYYNDTDWTANQYFLDLTILSEDGVFVFSKRFNVALYGIGYVEVDGKKYSAKNYDGWKIDPIIFDQSKGRILHISLHDIDEGVTSVRYTEGSETIELTDFTSKLEIDMSNKEEFRLIYTYNSSDYTIIIKKSRIVEKVRAYLLELDTRELLVEDVEYYESSFSSYFEVKASNFFSKNHLILKVVPIFADGVTDVTVKYFDKYYDKGEVDFTKCVSSSFVIKCYDKDGNVIGEYDVVPRVDGPDFESLNYGRITTSTGEITLPTFHDFDIYVDGVKNTSGIITYTEKGLYNPVVEYRVEYDGTIYSMVRTLQVTFTDNIHDFAESAGYHYYINTSGEGTAYVRDDENYISDSVYIIDIVALKNDYLFATPKEGYSFNKDKSTFGFIDLNDPEPKFYINYVFEKDGVEYNAFVLVHYFGELSYNTNVVDEIVTVKDSKNVKRTYEIIDNEVTVSISKDYDVVSFILENQNAYCYLYKNGIEIDDFYWDWETDERFFYAETGDYEVKIKPLSYNERVFTIHVVKSTDLISITRTNDESEFALYADINLTGNLKSSISEEGVELYGYFGDSSEYIEDDKVSLTITSPYLSTIYKDSNFQINAKESDIYDIYYDGTTPYAVLYIKGAGFESIKVRVYLAKRAFTSAKLTIGFDEFIIIADGGDEYGDLGKARMGGFTIDNDDLPNTMTLTTTKVYSDYSYSILMDIDGELFDYNTFEELEEAGYLFRVTDATTLSVTIPIAQTYFYIVPEGVTSFDFEEFYHVELTLLKGFGFDNEVGDRFYYNLKLDYENFEIIEYTNAMDKDKEPNAMFSNTLYFKLDQSELANMTNGTYRIKLDSNGGARALNSDLIEYVPEYGYITLPVDDQEHGIISFIMEFSFFGSTIRTQIILGVSEREPVFW